LDSGTLIFPGGRDTHRRIDDIEVLRAFAIGLVLVEHVRLNLIPWVSGEREWLYTHFGFWSGVDLFLAISGFVIARSLLPLLAEARASGAFFNAAFSFWVRRAFRLLPSAWVWLVVILACSAAFNRSGAFQPLHATITSVVAGALDYANIRTIFVYGHGSAGGAFHYWSLSLEEQFYLLFPFVAWFAGRRLPWVLAAVVLAQFFLYRNGPYSSVAFNMIKSDALSLGILLALWAGRPSWRRLAPAFLEPRAIRYLLPPVLLVLYSALTGAAWGPVQWRVGLAAAMGTAFVWIASYDRDLLFPPGAIKRFFCWMGGRSYGLYLIHPPAFFAAREIWFRVDPHYQDASLAHALILGSTGFFLLVVLAELNFRLVETPLRRRGARIAEAIRNRRRPAPAGLATPGVLGPAPAIDDEAQVRA
jgi:peptidoglycan/LPS O-acetylase OafA/YrhL